MFEVSEMSVRMLAVLQCDHEGCARRFAWANEEATWKPPRLTDARKLARVEGWRFGVRLRCDSGPAPTLDFCPEHAEEIATVSEVTL